MRRLLLLSALCAAVGAAQVEHTYKKTPQGELKLFVFQPADAKASDRRPAIVLSFGGGFRSGSPQQFYDKAKYLASRGMVAISAEYRVSSRHQTLPDASMEDCTSTMRWVRGNAAKLGIDPNRIAGGGGSAGATCIASVALTGGVDAPGEDRSISPKPNALVLYNPAVDVSSDRFGKAVSGEQLKTLERLFGLTRAVDKTMPPSIQFFGTTDALAEGGRSLAKAARAAGVRAEFFAAEGQAHGFFNSSPWHEATLRQTDVFLQSLGYLKGPPQVETAAALRSE